MGFGAAAFHGQWISRGVALRTSLCIRTHGAWQVGIAMVLALGMLVIGMEEVSWLQRVFGWQTPGWIRGTECAAGNQFSQHHHKRS